MNLTSLLVVINENTTDVSSISENIKCSGSRIQLLVYNNFCNNENIITQLKEISSTWLEPSTPFILNYSECVNELLRIATGDYICVTRQDCILYEDWLKVLIDSHTLIQSSGVISINDFSTSEGNYQLTKNNDLTWVYTDKFRINNFAFFNRELLFKIGGFNEHLNGQYVFWDFCDRAMLFGFYNYFVPYSSMIKLSEYTDHFLIPTYKEFQYHKTDSYYPLFQLSITDKENLRILTDELGKVFNFHEKLGCLIFIKKDSINIDFILKLCNKLSALNLGMELYSTSYFENDLLKMSFIGKINSL